ncbi:MAG: FMN-binding negative transcriptional regulator [Ktedonobacteraceae bacterium]|nr:FMN-binding negative transcriptional regulator [Ktedonobacteraceae bacterium]
MYVPKHFREEDLAVLQALMRVNSFATLISVQEDGVPVATPLPTLLEMEPAPYGTLKAHVALGNPQWHTLQQDREILVIFQGPHAYISPSWYEEQPSVPTWNYATVHAYGRPRLITEQAELYEHLRGLVTAYERGFLQPWQMEGLPIDYVDKMMKGVVGVSIEITRLFGKYKLSQNRSRQDQQQVIEQLQMAEDPSMREVASLMQSPRDAQRANLK